MVVTCVPIASDLVARCFCCYGSSKWLLVTVSVLPVEIACAGGCMVVQQAAQLNSIVVLHLLAVRVPGLHQVN